MKKIKVFLASSITELREDRVEIGNLFNEINEVFVDREIHFSLIKCENYDDSIALNGKQTEYDKEISDSAMCIFLFFKKVGDYTRHEFEVALDNFKMKSNPRILVYIKYVNTTDEMTAEVRNFAEFLDKELKHFYGMYNNIDTIKAKIWPQIYAIESGEKLEYKHGKVYFDNKVLYSLENVPSYSENPDLKKLKKQFYEIDVEYCRLRELVSKPENLEDYELYKQYVEVATRRKELEDALKIAEEKAIKSVEVINNAMLGDEVSYRQMSSMHALDTGDYEKALSAINKHSVLEDIKKEEEKELPSTQNISVYAKELMQRCSILSQMNLDGEHNEEMLEMFKEFYRLTEKYSEIDKSPLYDYAAFLAHLTKRKEAIAVLKKLKSYYAKQGKKADKRIISVLTGMGVLYQELEDYENTGKCYENAIKLGKQLTKAELLKYGGTVIEAYATMNALYASYILNKGEKVKEIAVEEFEFCKEYMEKGGENGEYYLAISYGELAIYAADNDAQALDYCRMSVELLRKLADEKSISYRLNLAVMLSRMATVYIRMFHYKDAKNCYEEAIQIYEEEAKNAPSINAAVAIEYNNLAALYQKANKIQEAVEYMQKALDIWRKKSCVDPVAFEINVANGCRNLAVIIESLDKKDPRIKALYEEALAITQRRYHTDLRKYGAFFIEEAFAMATLYCQNKDLDAANSLACEIYDVANQLCDVSYEQNKEFLLDAYVINGNVCFEMRKCEEAEVWYEKALDLFNQILPEIGELQNEAGMFKVRKSLSVIYLSNRKFGKMIKMCFMAYTRYWQAIFKNILKINI